MTTPSWLVADLLFSHTHEFMERLEDYQTYGVIYGLKQGVYSREQAIKHYGEAATMAVRVTRVVLWNLHQKYNNGGLQHGR